ncbi:MAG: ARMT1-like domain-containing protein [Desulfurococcales archaeon]|nr:ARMT1-like domain-containing protein [Desulfurococcales archaeon]
MVWKGIIHPVHCWSCLVKSRGLGKAELESELADSMWDKASSSRTRAFIESYSIMAERLGYDPLKEEKARLNEEALEVVDRDFIGRLDFRGILKVMAAANAVDWGLEGYRFSIRELLDGWSEALVMDYPYTEADSVVVVLDNAGEAVVDLLAAERLKELGFNVVVVARSEFYETDITVDEAVELSHRMGLNLTIIGTGSRYPGTFYPELPYNLKGLLEYSDIVLAKGIANLEAASESMPLGLSGKFYHLLRAKCIPISEVFDVDVGTPLVTSLKRASLYIEDYARRSWSSRGIQQ